MIRFWSSFGNWILIGVIIVLALVAAYSLFFRQLAPAELESVEVAPMVAEATEEAAVEPIAEATEAAPVATEAAVEPVVSPSLNYDKNNAYQGNCMDDTDSATDPKVAGQTHYVAYLICVANAAGRKQADLEGAIGPMQVDAQNAHAKTLSGNVITLDNESAWLVWIPNATGLDYSLVPNDTAYPSGLEHEALGQIWIVPAYAAGVNGRTFTAPEGVDFWAVAVH